MPAQKIEVQARVIEKFSSNKFQVELENGLNLKPFVCLSGKMRMNNIKVFVGDTVTIELSPYDLNIGRIIRKE